MRSVSIQVYIKDVPESEKAGWQLGIWGRNSKSIKKEDIWGLAIDGWPTQMCYSMDYTKPWPNIRRRKEKYEKYSKPNWLHWYFDVGRKLYVTLDDLATGLNELGIEDE